MEDTNTVLAAAAERALELKLGYAGALLPTEACTLMMHLPEAKLLDVGTRAELEWVGYVPGSLAIEWNTWPGGNRNLDFVAQCEASIAKDAIVMILCRSGVRSHHAAAALARAGYARAYNVLQGFEGDKDPNGQRNRVGGWRAAGLPWKQR